MNRRVLLCLLVACKSADKPAPDDHASAAPTHHEDRAEPAAPAALVIDATVDGTPVRWEKDAFAKVPKLTGTNNGGESRDMWSLRELAHTLVGPNARVVAVGGGTETKAIDRAAWDDPSRTPVLQTTRRGTFKFRWTDASGKWGEAEVKDASRLEIVTR